MVKLLVWAGGSSQCHSSMTFADWKSHMSDIMSKLGETKIIKASASLEESAHIAGQANDLDSASKMTVSLTAALLSIDHSHCYCVVYIHASRKSGDSEARSQSCDDPQSHGSAHDPPRPCRKELYHEWLSSLPVIPALLKDQHRDPLRGVHERNLIEQVRPGSDIECVVLPRFRPSKH